MPKTFVNHGRLPVVILFLARNQPVEALDFRLLPGQSQAKDFTRPKGCAPVTKLDFNWLLSRTECQTVTVDLLEDASGNDHQTYHLYDEFIVVTT